MWRQVRAYLAVGLRSFAVENYRRFAVGQFVKSLGVWMQFTAQDWLVLTLTDNSAYALGVVSALQFLPVLLLTLSGGALADRHDKRRLLIVSNAALGVLALAMAALVTSGSITLHWVYLLAATMGVVNAIEAPARQSFAVELVERALVPNALSLSTALYNVARIVGPALSGVLIWLLGMPAVFGLNVLSYLAPAVALLSLRTTELHRNAGRPRGHARIRDGISYVWHRHDLLQPVLLLLAIGLLGLNFQLTLPVMAKSAFAVGPGAFGLLSTSLAVGSLCGALVGTRRRERPSGYTVLRFALAFGALETLVGFAPSLLGAAALLVPTGYCMVAYVQATNQSLQMGTDDKFRGRVMALFLVVVVGTTPAGSLLVGWLSSWYGPRVGLWGGGLLSLLAAAAALGWQLRHSGARLRVSLLPHPRVYVSEEPKAAATDAA